MADPHRRFVLLDRDGTIMADKHYLADPAGVELLPGAVAGLKRLQELGFGLAVVTNQSGIGRGYFSAEDAEAVNARLAELLAAEGVDLSGSFTCPHAPEEACDCRKPAPGLAEQAARELDFAPREAFVIGDKASDVELARRMGAVAVLVRTGKGRETEAALESALERGPDFVADDLAQAAELIAAFVQGKD